MTLFNTHSKSLLTTVRAAVLLTGMGMLSMTTANNAFAAVTPANTEIENTAVASYQVAGVDFTKAASVSLTTQEINPGPIAPTPAEISLGHYDDTGTSNDTYLTDSECSDSAGNYTSLTGFTDLSGTSHSLPGNYSLSDDQFGYKVGEPLFILMTEGDKNINPVRPDQIVITISSSDGSDTETIRLTETGNNTGKFAGVLPTAVASNTSQSYNCVLSVKSGQTVVATYQDAADSTDIVSDSTRFDPSSRVFNAATGAPINGVSITLIDVATGLPADGKVFEDDGVTPYPSTVKTGPAPTISASAVTPSFADGAFRFPVIANGEYKLQVSGPADFRIPSDLTDDELINTPNGPFDITAISRGESFTVNNRVFVTDIGADPLDTNLLLSKTASKNEAGVGDFVEFTIRLSNGEVLLNDAEVKDQLPAGLRYRQGSARINGVKVEDPSISSKGTLLTFTLPEVSAEASLTLSYVTQVTTLAKGQVTNTAWINDDVVVSNRASARVSIRDDFYKDNARLFGRVFLDDCNGNQESADGVPNIRLFMEDGTYVVTDEAGEWHIEDVKPGTHVVQIDKATVPPYMELMECDLRGFHAGRDFSQFVDVQGGSFWRVDFALKMLEPDMGEVTQQLNHELVPLDIAANQATPYNSPVKQKVRFTIDVKGTGLPVNNVIQMIALPDGLIYQTGTTDIDGVASADPEISYGTLIYRLGDKPESWSHQIHFDAIVTDQAQSGDLVTRSITRFQAEGQTPQQVKAATTTALLVLPPADGEVKPVSPPKFANFSDVLTDEDKQNLRSVIERLDGLDNLKIQIVGHTDSTRISKRNQHIFADNQALSEARAKSVATYLAEELKVAGSQVTALGKGATVPVASNASAEGRAQNRRVEVKVLNADAVLSLKSQGSDLQVAGVQSLIPGFTGLPATAAGNPAQMPSELLIPEFDEQWFDTAADDAQWLWPPLDRSPAIGSIKIAISHAKKQRVVLTLNGSPVSALNYDGTTASTSRDLMVSQWRGVDIQPGANRFGVTILDSNGDVVSEFEKTVHFSQDPAKAELVLDQSTVIADGINPPTIAVRLTDKDGFPIRAKVQGEVEVLAPYQLYDEARQIEANPLAMMQTPHYQVGNDGITRIQLAPTFQAGEAVLRFHHSNGQTDELRVWLKPQDREWILVGLGDLSVGYNAGGGDNASMKAAGIDDNIYSDGRVAFFTQGQVSGEWLITAAYDSGKAEAEPFARVIEPDRYYTLYGDASQQQLDASSARKLYVRVERERFYTVFGDINTDLNVTTLGRYNRKLTGLQSVYQGDVVELSGFISQTNQGFVRDEIQGDGTSGLYRLQKQQLVLNSENVSLEIRDRYRSEVVLSTQLLQRDVDYVIDYQDGTIYFKSPIASTDASFNPRYIVVEYEVDPGDNLGYISGGRAGVKLLGDTVRAGVTAITQNQTGDDRNLQALDATVKLGDTEITAEIAQSEEVVAGDATTANAHRIEIAHRNEVIEAKAYVQSQENGFGLEQTSDSENDYRKEGVEGNWYITDRDRLQVLGFHHYGLSTELNSYQSQVDWIHRLDDDQQFSFGVITAQNESTDETIYTDQLSAGFSRRFMNNRMTLSSQLLGNVSERSDAYDRLLLGADYRLDDDYSLFAEHETGFESDAPQRSVFGVRATPWAGARAEQSIEQVEQDDSYRLFAVSGLSQEFLLNEAWSLSTGFEQSQDLENSAPEEIGTSENFHAVYVGSAYRTPIWQWNNRVEYRNGNINDKWVARTSLYHPLSDALATGGSVNWFHENGDDTYSNQLDARFDLALRPRKDPFALLWQTRWVQEAYGGSGIPDRTRKLINNIHANWLITERDQLAGQYGIKRVLDQYGSGNYASTTDFMATEWRHHLTERWDVGAHGRRLHGYEAGQVNHGAGVSVGYIPKTNVWVGLGYNFTGFIDSDFSAANFTAKGVYLKLRFKADQESLATMRAAFQ